MTCASVWLMRAEVRMMSPVQAQLTSAGFACASLGQRSLQRRPQWLLCRPRGPTSSCMASKLRREGGQGAAAVRSDSDGAFHIITFRNLTPRAWEHRARRARVPSRAFLEILP